MKTAMIITLVLMSSAFVVSGQSRADSLESKPKNNIFLNLLGGDGSISSLNYERLFLIRSKIFFAGGLGIGYSKDASESGLFELSHIKFMTLPHHFTMNIGKRRSYFEFGLGGTAVIGNTDQEYYLAPILGYRFYSRKLPTGYFRIYGSVPFWGWYNSDLLWIPVGFSIGAGF